MALSSSSASVAVDKATSDLLIAPDWTMNMDICDAVNSNHWQAKDVVKAVKKRLQHKSSRVQILSLTLLETMVKNCGDHVHFLIAERNILGEMVKIVKKKADMQVRNKILVLLDSWQEAFGGPGGKHPQYYWAYDELRRSGVEFPRRESDSALIFTPPGTHPILRHAQAGFGMPSNSPRRLDEAMASEVESLSLSSLESMRNVMELLDDMLQAVNPSDRAAVRDEIIVDLVERCRSNQKTLMHMLTTTGDEELLGHGLELNDSLQGLLAKHDAIASGLPLPSQVKSLSPLSPQTTVSSSSSPKPTEEARDSSPRPNANPVFPATNVIRSCIDEEEEEDDFAQLARRHSKAQSVPSQSTSAGTSDSRAIINSSDGTVSSASASTCTALVLPDPPGPVKTKEQEIIDLLSITLSTTSTSPHAPQSPSISNQDTHQVPLQGHPSASQTAFPGNQGQAAYNSYVVPWAQPQQMQPHSQYHQPQPQVQSQAQYRQPQMQVQSQAQYRQPQIPVQSQAQYRQPQIPVQSQAQYRQPQIPVQSQAQYARYSYPPPPWAGTSSNQEVMYTSNAFYTPQVSTTTSYTPMELARPVQHQHNSLPSRVSNGLPVPVDARNPASAVGQKPFVPSYRLFEELNVLGSADGKLKMVSSASQSLSETSGQRMVGGRK